MPNLTSLVARSATYALSTATVPYVMKLAQRPLAEVLREEPTLASGVSVMDGKITHAGLAANLGVEAVDLETVLAGAQGGGAS